MISEFDHVFVNTSLDFVWSLERETASSVRALAFAQVSFLSVQVNFWTGFAHHSLHVVGILRWNFVTNRLDSFVWSYLQIRVEWAVALSGASVLPIAVSLSPADLFLSGWRADAFSSGIGPLVMEAIVGGAQSLTNALAQRIAPLGTLTVIGGHALAWSPLIIGVDMAAASELGTVAKHLQFCNENIFAVWSFLWKVGSIIEVQSGEIDEGHGFIRFGVFYLGGTATAVQEQSNSRDAKEPSGNFQLVTRRSLCRLSNQWFVNLCLHF